MDAREKTLLEAVQRHFDAELENNVEKTLETLTDDVVYEHPFYDDVKQGLDEVRDYYRRSWAVAPFREIHVNRYWICGDDVVILEVDAVTGHPDDTRRSRVVTVCTMRDGKLAREIVYGQDTHHAAHLKPRPE